jgi:hypothetical protein
MDSVPDRVKSLICLNVRRVQRILSFQRLEQTLDIEHKQTPTGSIRNEVSSRFSLLTSLLGFTFQNQVLIQHPRGQNAIALLPNTFVQNFQKETWTIMDSGLDLMFLQYPHCLFPLSFKQKVFLI